MQTIKKFGPLFIIIAALLWSFDAILRRDLYTLPPAVVVFWEHALGALVLLPFVIRKPYDIRTLKRSDWLAISVVSLFSGALGTIFYTAALGKVQYIQFSVVVLLQQLQPIWAITTASLVLKEKITKKFFLWAALAIIASYAVTFKDLRVNIAQSPDTAIAALLAISAGIMWGSSTSFSKIVLHKTSFLTATFLRFLLAPLFAFIILLIMHQNTSLLPLTTNQWSSLLIIMLSTGMVALLIYYYGLQKTPAKNSAIYELIWPISAIGIDYFYYHHGLSPTQLIGALVVLFAMYKISFIKDPTRKIYTGKVLRGTQDGRTIGFPTINLDPGIVGTDYKEGIYAAKVTVDKKTYPGALYYGPRLVKGEHHPVLEIHILDFDKEIYGQTVKFEIKKFIREKQDFPSLKALKKQINSDITAIKSALHHR